MAVTIYISSIRGGGFPISTTSAAFVFAEFLTMALLMGGRSYFLVVFFFKKNIQLYIYLAVCLGLNCHMQEVLLQPVGSSFLTRDQIGAPCIDSTASQPLDGQGGPFLLALICISPISSNADVFCATNFFGRMWVKGTSGNRLHAGLPNLDFFFFFPSH